MKKAMTAISIISVFMTMICTYLYISFGQGFMLSLSITFGTIAYHFVMRLSVGYAVNAVMHNKADYTKKRYQCGKQEMNFYKLLRVKQWKAKMPTYDPDLFDLKKHSLAEVAEVSCQAETVHEIIVVLSFVPILFSIPVGETSVFVITSVLAALFDLLFVIMQRYNRGRIKRI